MIISIIDYSTDYFLDWSINRLVDKISGKKKLNAISQSPSWCVLSVKNPKLFSFLS